MREKKRGKREQKRGMKEMWKEKTEEDFWQSPFPSERCREKMVWAFVLQSKRGKGQGVKGSLQSPSLVWGLWMEATVYQMHTLAKRKDTITQKNNLHSRNAHNVLHALYTCTAPLSCSAIR